jgi:hypothetical protein
MALLTYTAEPIDEGASVLSVPLAARGFEPAPAMSFFNIPTAEDWIDRNINPLLATPLGVGSGESTIGNSVQPQFVRGRVQDADGFGVARIVIAVDRATGRALGSTVSDAAGNFLLRPRSIDPILLIAVPAENEPINAVVLDLIQPLPV